MGSIFEGLVTVSELLDSEYVPSISHELRTFESNRQ